jgi:hypothetical protein
MQLASSGLLSGLGGNPPPELLKTLQYNPILYYSYYAQMLSALQTQQKLLELNTTPPTVPSTNNNNNNNIKDLLSPLRLGGLASLNKESMQVKILAHLYTIRMSNKGACKNTTRIRAMYSMSLLLLVSDPQDNLSQVKFSFEHKNWRMRTFPASARQLDAA